MNLVDPVFLERVAAAAREAVIVEWRLQGHELTGAAAAAVETRIKERAGGLDIEGYVIDYMAYLNAGIPPDRVPYAGRTGAGGRSKYIEGLTRYAQARMGLSRKEAERVAFAIASVHRREGIPSMRSQAFSSTGRRTGFIEAGLEKAEGELERLIVVAISASLDTYIDSFFGSLLPGR